MLPALPPTSFEQRRAFSRFTLCWTLLAVAVIIGCAVGATFGWIAYFEDDGFAPQFALARSRNAALQAAINAENATRTAEDALLTAEQAATLAALNEEIATRTAQDALLLSLVNAEIAARTAEQAALNASLVLEIEEREAFDTLAFSELADLTNRLNLLTAYNVFAQQEFITAYQNLTLLEQDLVNETAARIASENILSAQDTAQQNFIALFASELAAEIATRTSEGETQLADITAFLNDGILTINNQSSLNHNFNFVSANAGFSIGSGGTNIITITNHAVLTVDGVTPDPTTFDISILANGNVVVTPGINSLTFGLVIVPPLPNYAMYHGSWVASIHQTCPITFSTTEWQFDAFNLPTCAGNLFITNYNTPAPNPGYGWQVPTSGGVGYGVWLVRVVLTLTVQYDTTPNGVALSMGLCVQTRGDCIANPAANQPGSSLVWQMYQVFFSGYLPGAGLDYQDHTFKSTLVLDGRGLPDGFGVFPVWRQWQPRHSFTSSAYLDAISVEYDVTQLA